MDMMKERFAKLLLGEDMSGGGKGVSSALALSDAITNLSGNTLETATCLHPELGKEIASSYNHYILSIGMVNV